MHKGGPPLARGSHVRHPGQLVTVGWTPARAGKPRGAVEQLFGEGVDPRSRGEASSAWIDNAADGGGPPLARGSPMSTRAASCSFGWTPARAGKPPPGRPAPRARKVDPRSRGEATTGTRPPARSAGGPPLARGSQRRGCAAQDRRGWTPARAGKPLWRSTRGQALWVDPRSRGEAALDFIRADAERGGPPLARGSLAVDERGRDAVGWTPARAGKPR